MASEWPDLKVLELLVAVSLKGSLGAAARSVGMAQPNASRALSQLEKSLNLALLERTPRGSRLTPAGAVVVDWSRSVLEAAERLLSGSAALRSEQLSHVAVGASMTVAEHLMPLWLGELRRRQPDVEIRLEVANSAEIFERVAAGAYDVGFVESRSVPAGLACSTVATDRLVLVVSAEHRWAARRSPVEAAELAAERLVVREPGSGTRSVLDDALAPYERAEPLLELNSNAAVKISVAAGVGPAVLSGLAVEAALRTGELRAVPVAGVDLRRKLRAVWTAGRRLSDPAAELVHLARRVAPPGTRAVPTS